jgi:IMP dehydrogenase/GMP reductase
MNNLFTLDDIVLIPAVFSKIKHRSQCSPYVRKHSLLPGTNAKLPLFTAPMSCVINDKNYVTFKINGINTIIPRNVDINTRLRLSKNTFVALGLEEFKTLIDNNDSLPYKMFILIDIANGHMEQLYVLSKLAKEKYKENLVLMVGNIANPETYIAYSMIGVDYVRCGIGTSPVCTTSANSGVHYPMGSLLEGIREKKLYYGNKGIKFAKIVADGGFSNFDQINKALALGADFVMLGKIFAKAEEACGEIIDFPNYDEEETVSHYREYYGMSTKRAQKEFGKEGNKTAEGISTLVQIDYTIAGWVDNFKHYLQSAMSYTDCVTLDEFKTKVRYSTITPNARIAYFK